MRITHLNKRYWPHIGGVERSLHAIARACVRQGDRVTALVCAPSARARRRIVDGVEVLEAPSFGVFQSQPIAPSFLALPNFETVWHLHEPFPLGTLAFLIRLAARRTSPLIVTWHSDVVRQRTLKPVHAALARRVLEHAALIHVPSMAHINASEILPHFRDKVRAIPFIVDIESMRRQPTHPLAVDLRKWANGRQIAVAVGRLVYYKGVDVLLDAVSEVPDVCVAIVGEGPLRDLLESQAARLGIEGRVRWLGAISDEDLVGVFSAGDFFVLSSVARSEAFGLVQVEAMAAGLPVISTRLGTAVEVVNIDGVTGVVVPPRDPARLAGAMRILARDVRKRDELRLGALAHASDFAEARLVDQYRALYAEALGG
jgi:rhamnosyl/mannosyltransferase